MTPAVADLIRTTFPHDYLSRAQLAAIESWVDKHMTPLLLANAKMAAELWEADELRVAVAEMAAAWGSARQCVDEERIVDTAWWRAVGCLRGATEAYRAMRTTEPRKV